MRWYTKYNATKKWYTWFAWYPVRLGQVYPTRVDTGEWAWLEKVQRYKDHPGSWERFRSLEQATLDELNKATNDPEAAV